MRILRAILVLIALGYGFSFALDVQMFGSSSDRGFYTEGYPGWTRLEPLLISSFCGLWYYGLRTKRLWAWRLGTPVFGVLCLWLVYGGVKSVLRPSGPLDGWDDMLSRTISAALLFWLYWSWWFRCRPLFVRKFIAQRGASPDGGPSEPPGNLRADGGPPSVS